MLVRISIQPSSTSGVSYDIVIDHKDVTTFSNMLEGSSSVHTYKVEGGRFAPEHFGFGDAPKWVSNKPT